MTMRTQLINAHHMRWLASWLRRLYRQRVQRHRIRGKEASRERDCQSRWSPQEERTSPVTVRRSRDLTAVAREQATERCALESAEQR